MHTLHVIDLSHHNAVRDLGQTKAAGVIGVFHKATEGVGYTDPAFAIVRSLAASHGLLWASYHFLRHADIAAQMRHYLAVAQPAGGERVCIDYEQADCTLDDLHAAVSYLRSHAPNNPITIYGGNLLKEQLGDRTDDLLASTSLWIAQYTSADAPRWAAATWPAWSLWQYSDGQFGGEPKSVPGIDRCDCNTFNGTENECRAWFGGSDAAAAAPAPTASEKPTLRLGDRNSAVLDLQTRLALHGLAIACDGIFGSATERAVRGFQRRSGLVVDGVAGAKTWAALNG
ncbi:MAG: cell-wall lytic protein [Rhizobiaceae bacterium]|nr:MAG: cell-wall lytic protein [Rhizobiaceae bacterium]